MYIVAYDSKSTWLRGFKTSPHDQCFVLNIVGMMQLPKYIDPLNINAMACPAMPLCPLAIAEAERGIPDILKRARSVFEKVFC